jgi:hypothetical protein
MSQVPTIKQYLLDLLVKSQLDAADRTKDPKQIALAEKKYKGLTEKEVEFGDYVLDPKTGKYSVKLVAKTRNWTLQKMTFNTGTIEALSRKNQQGAAQISALEMVTSPGLIYVQENDSRYLAVEPDANIFEAMKLTGYEFPADSFVPTIYGEPKEDSKAVGQVDLDHPIVAGRFLLYYIGQHSLESLQNGEGEKKPTDDKDLKMQGDTNASSDNTQANAQANSNEGDQANPGSTQTQLKTPAEPGQSENGPEGQANSANGTADPAEVAKENEETAKENEEGFQAKKDQNKIK